MYGSRIKPWNIDSAASDHMTGEEDLFVEMEQSKGNVTFGDESKASVKGKEKNYDIYFKDRSATIRNQEGNLISKVPMSKNRMFILNIQHDEAKSLKSCLKDNSWLWYMRRKGLKIKSMRSDRDREFLSKEFNKFFEDNGIQRFLTNPYSPQQNGVVERKKRTILNMVQSMLKTKKMPKEFWVEAVDCAVYLLNRYPSKSLDNKTLQEAWNGLKPTVSHLRVFGSIAYVHVLSQRRLKLNDIKTWSSMKKDHGIRAFRNLIGQKAIRVKWVYKAKKNAKGEVEKYKARLVAKGYKQKHGIDYEEVFALVAHLKTIRMMIAIAAQHKWKIYQMDVKSAFLNGLLEKEVYVEQPEGYVAKGQEGKVLRLKKALYGLKQAPCAWNTRIDKYFQEHGFRKYLSEYALYVKFENKSILLACLYVDDLIFTGNSQSMINELKKSMTDIGLMSYYLGIEVKQTDEGIFICQEKYSKEILKRFGMDKCNPVGTPIEHKVKSSKHDGGKAVDSTLFKSLVGKYIAATSCVCHAIWLRSMLKELHMKQEDATEIYVDNKSAINLPNNPVYHD
nr:reverse transcriptase [Tanacetum cinerariifolium]